MEPRLARINSDRDEHNEEVKDDAYLAEVLLETEDPKFDYELRKYMDRAEIPR